MASNAGSCTGYVNSVYMNHFAACETRQVLKPYLSLLTDENVEALSLCGENFEHVAEGLRALHDADPILLTQENFDTLIASTEYAEDVAQVLTCLYEADPNLLTPGNRCAIVVSGKRAEDVSRGLDKLNEVHLVTQENFDALILSGEDAVDVARGIVWLNAADILTPANRNALVASKENIWAVVLGLRTLSEANRNVLKQKNSNELFANEEDAEDIARKFACFTLHKTDSRCFAENNFAARNASEEYKTFNEVENKVNSNLLTQDNFDTLMAGGKNVWAVARGIKTLNEADPNLLTLENRRALVASGKYAEEIACGLCILNGADPNLLTQENRHALIERGADVQDLVSGLRALNKADLLTQVNFDALVIASGDNVEEVVWAVEDLAEAGLLTQVNFDRLFDGDFSGNRESILNIDDRLPNPLTQTSFDEFTESLVAKRWSPNESALMANAATMHYTEKSGLFLYNPGKKRQREHDKE